MRCRRAWRACALVLALVVHAAGAGDTDLLDYLTTLHSFEATFTQQRYDETGELLETARGSCKILRPGRFRWLYQEPYQQTIVADGVKLWIYDQDLEQVTVNNITTGAPGTPAELLSEDVDVAARYTIVTLGQQTGYDWYRLTPKSAVSEFQRIELGLAAGEVKAMRLEDNFGQKTTLTFDAIRRNAPLAPGEFNFTPPAGVDVIEGGAP